MQVISPLTLSLIKSYFFKAVIVAMLFAMGGCASQIGSPLPQCRYTEPYAMAPLDSAQMTMSNGSHKELLVSQDGKVDLPSGSRQVEGMPVEAFKALLLKSYPSAREITISEFRTDQVTVLGEVFHQIHTDLSDGPMRVMDAIAAANGFTPLANKRRVRLLRQNAGEVEVYELNAREMMRGNFLEQNILLKPGDVITVPRNFL